MDRTVGPVLRGCRPVQERRGGCSPQLFISLEQKTRWHVLTVAFGEQRYEARAVRIGGWAGARRETRGLFEEVRRLSEVDLALGNLVYRDIRHLPGRGRF